MRISVGLKMMLLAEAGTILLGIGTWVAQFERTGGALHRGPPTELAAAEALASQNQIGGKDDAIELF